VDVVAAELITDVDPTAADMLEDLDEALNAKGISMVLAEMKDPESPEEGEDTASWLLHDGTDREPGKEVRGGTGSYPGLITYHAGDSDTGSLRWSGGDLGQAIQAPDGPAVGRRRWPVELRLADCGRHIDGRALLDEGER
jgi:hypothetical protein